MTERSPSRARTSWFGGRALVLGVVGLLGGTVSSHGLEVDCKACDYCCGRGDLAHELTERIQAHLAQGRSAQQIAQLEGGTNWAAILRPPIALWANQHPQAVPPDPAKLKYRGSRLPNNWFFTSYEPCIRLCGNCVGTDKLGHLFQQGWEYYTISVLDEKGDRVAERYGEWLEGLEPRESYADLERWFRRLPAGRMLGYGAFGRTMSGVISHADLAANKAGLRLYKDLAGGRFQSLCDYITPQLCEEVNPNEYTPEMQAVLEKNTPPAADWPRLGGADDSYVSPQTGLCRAWPATGPRLLWTVQIGQGYAGVAVRDGQVYLLDRRADREDLLRCFNLASGQEEWQWSYEAPGSLPYPGSRNVPTVDQLFVFTLGPMGHFSCVDRRTHQRVWSTHLITDFKDPSLDRNDPPTNRTDQLARAQVPTWGLTQAPLLYQDTVIVAPQTRKVGLVAYEKATGQIRWRSDYVGRNWYSHVSPRLARLCGVEQIIMLAQPSDPEKTPDNAPPSILSAVDPGTGRVLWMTNTPGPHKIPLPQPLPVGEDRLFITGGYGLGSVMLQVIRTNGTWTTRVIFHNRTVVGHIHSPVFYRDNIYLQSFREQGAAWTGLVCLNREGRLLWQTGPGLQFHDGGMLLADGMAVIMNGQSGHLSLLDLAASGPSLLAEAKVLNGPQVWAPLALAEGKILVRDQRQLKCLELVQGTPDRGP